MTKYAVSINSFYTGAEKEIGHSTSLLEARKMVLKALMKKDTKGWQGYIFNTMNPDKSWGVGIALEPSLHYTDTMVKPSIGLKKGAYFTIYDGKLLRKLHLNGELGEQIWTI